jgi:hypothetical protein
MTSWLEQHVHAKRERPSRLAARRAAVGDPAVLAPPPPARGAVSQGPRGRLEQGAGRVLDDDTVFRALAAPWRSSPRGAPRWTL